MITEQIGLDLLRTYVDVCRQGSLNRVAAQTGRTQSALSMQMRKLESLLDRQLFRRTGRGVVPTTEGELFLGYAIRILALSDEAVARLQRTEISGCVRIGLAEEVAAAALPAALGRLHRAYPDLRLDVMVEQSIPLGHLWQDGGLDVMIAPTSAVTGDPAIAWTVELQWVCAPEYILDLGRRVDLITFTAPCLWRRRTIEALTAAGLDHQVTLASQSITALQAAIENGLGIGVLPQDAVRPGAMRVLKPAVGVPEPLAVQYGLYAPDRRSRVVEAAIAVLIEGVPAAPALGAVRDTGPSVCSSHPLTS